MDMPRPNEHHRALARLAGNWRGDEKMHPSPWDPQGGTATGEIENRVALDGLILVQDYRQVRAGAVTFRGHGVFSWSPGARCYELHWFDSMGMPPNAFRGALENGVLTMTSEGPQGSSRVSFDLREEGEYSFTMDMSLDGRTWRTMMEGRYQRS